jgi:hypothetical protein
MRALRFAVLIIAACGLRAQTFYPFYTGDIRGFGRYMSGAPTDYGGALADDGNGGEFRMLYTQALPSNDYSITTPIVYYNSSSGTYLYPYVWHYLRDNGSGTYYQVQFYTSSYFVLSRVTSQGSTYLASAGAPSVVNQFTSLISGNAITVSVNGTTLFTYTDTSAPLTTGSPGVGVLSPYTNGDGTQTCGWVANNQWYNAPCAVGISTVTTLSSPVPPNPVPTVSSISPNSVIAGSPALTVTITGTNFVPSSVATAFGATFLTSYVSPTQLTVTIPASYLVSVPYWPQIYVSNPLPAGGVSGGIPLAVVPGLTAIAPSAVPAGTGDLYLTLTGSGFNTNSVVNWNGSARVALCGVGCPTQLTALIRAADFATAGVASVTVVTSTSTGGASSAPLQFSVNAPLPVPAITSVNPSSVGAGSATFPITITGSGFVPSSTVQWNGSTRSAIYNSATSMIVTILASDVSLPGPNYVTVVNASNTARGGGTSNSQPVTVLAQSVISGLVVAFQNGRSASPDGFARPPDSRGRNLAEPRGSKGGYSVQDLTGGTGIAGVNVTLIPLAGGPTLSTTTNSSGAYAVQVPPNGGYTVTFALSGYTFDPVALTVSASSNENASTIATAAGSVPPALSKEYVRLGSRVIAIEGPVVAPAISVCTSPTPTALKPSQEVCLFSDQAVQSWTVTPAAAGSFTSNTTTANRGTTFVVGSLAATCPAPAPLSATITANFASGVTQTLTLPLLPPIVISPSGSAVAAKATNQTEPFQANIPVLWSVTNSQYGQFNPTSTAACTSTTLTMGTPPAGVSFVTTTATDARSASNSALASIPVSVNVPYIAPINCPMTVGTISGIAAGQFGTTTVTLPSSCFAQGNVGITGTSSQAGITFPGATATSPASGQSSSVAMVINVASTVPQGSYSASIIASMAGQTVTQSATVTVIPPPSFTFSASPTMVSLAASQTATFYITVAAAGGCPCTVPLSVSSSAGVSAQLASSSVSVSSGTATVAVTVTIASAMVGNGSVTIQAGSGSSAQSQSVSVTAVPDFSISSGGDITLTAGGAAGSTTISTSGSGGFSAGVIYGIVGSLPAGLSNLTFSPASTSGNGSTSMSVSATATGYYSLTVSGTSQSNVKTAQVGVRAGNPPPPFTLAVGNYWNGVTAGTTATYTISVTGTAGTVVNLSANGAPSGWSATLSPATLTVPGSATYSITPPPNIFGANGSTSYNITITGTGPNGSSNSVTLQLDVYNWVSTPPTISNYGGSATGAGLSASSQDNALSQVGVSWQTNLGNCYGDVYLTTPSDWNCGVSVSGSLTNANGSIGASASWNNSIFYGLAAVTGMANDSNGNSFFVTMPGSPFNIGNKQGAAATQGTRRTMSNGNGGANDGSISGIVLDPNGKPVANVTVHSMVPPAAANAAKYQKSASDGTFALSNLSTTTQHAICADASNQHLLNPCIWSPNSPAIASLTAAPSSATNTLISLKQGGMIRLQVNDPFALLAVTETKHGTALVVHAVAKDGSSMPQPAIKLNAATGRNYNVLVPPDKPVKLMLYNKNLNFKDASGNVLKNAVIEIDTQYNSKGKNDPIVLTVVGTH